MKPIINANANTIYPAATFTASRDELVGADPLLGSAEIARGVCRTATRHISVLAITTARMRKVDGWLGDVGFASHSAAPDPTRSLIGSVCDRTRADELIGSIVESLVGPVPDQPVPSAVRIGSIGALSPSSLPDGVVWALIVSAAATYRGSSTERLIAIATDDGLAAADLASLTEPVDLAPIDASHLQARIELLVGRPARSVTELLGDT